MQPTRITPLPQLCSTWDLWSTRLSRTMKPAGGLCGGGRNIDGGRGPAPVPAADDREGGGAKPKPRVRDYPKGLPFGQRYLQSVARIICPPRANSTLADWRSIFCQVHAPAKMIPFHLPPLFEAFLTVEMQAPAPRMPASGALCQSIAGRSSPMKNTATVPGPLWG